MALMTQFQQGSESLFLPPVYPSKDDIARGTIEINQYQKQLMQTDKALATLSAIIASLQRDRHNLEALLKRSQSSIMPFIPSRLPSEILDNIFLHVEDTGGSPWTLVQICRAWRVAAMENSRLWNRLLITTLTTRLLSGPIQRGRWKDGYEHCCTEAHLYEALERSRSAPLELQIVERSHVGSTIYFEDDYGVSHAEVLDMLTLLGGTLMARWRTISLTVTRDSTGALEALFNNPHASLTSLESMSFNGPLPEALLLCLDRTNRKLRHIKPGSDSSNDVVTLCQRPSFANLETLELGVPITFQAIAQVLSQCSSLKLLAVTNEDRHRDIQEVDPILCRLESLILADHGALNPALFLASLVHLELRLVGTLTSHYQATKSQFCLPHLIALKAAGSSAIQAICRLVCPVLQELYICESQILSRTDEALESLCWSLEGGSCQIAPVTLKLRNVAFSSTSLLGVLLQMGSITRMEMYPQSQNSWPLSIWQTFYTPTGNGSYTCPNLRTMIIRGLRDTDDNTLPVLEELVNRRAVIGLPVTLQDKRDTEPFPYDYPPERDFLMINGGELVNGVMRSFSDTHDSLGLLSDSESDDDIGFSLFD